jgi:hypothetical protein
MTDVRALLRSSWTWLVAGLILVGLISLIGAGRSNASSTLDASSAKPDGGLALRLWLERIGYHVSVGNGRPDLGSLAPGATVALLAAGADVGSRDVGALIAWVRRGGHILLATDGSTGGTLLDRLGVTATAATGNRIRVDEPLLLNPPVATLSGAASVALQGQPSDVEVAAEPAGSALLLRRLGGGSIWLLSAPKLLDNSHLALADNRRLALNLAGPRGSPLLFDQYRPPTGGAAGTSAGAWLTNTAWGVALLFLVAVLLLYRWLAGRRLGPAVVPLRLQFRPATEYVVSLAGLLRRGRQRQDVLAIYQASLRRIVRRRYGEIESAGIDRSRQDTVRALLQEPATLSESELVRLAQAIVREEERLSRRE